MNFFKVLLTVSALGVLTGCGEYLTREFMNGPKPCLPSEQSRVISNNNRLIFLEAGQTKEELLSKANMGEPDGYDTKKIQGDREIELFYYKVSSATCQWASHKEYLYEPVIVENNVVVGYGPKFYDQYIVIESPKFYGELLSFSSFN